MATDVISLISDRITDKQIFTPLDICIDMVNSLPDNIFNKDSKFLDIYCKSGRFLVTIYNKLMSSEEMIKTFPSEKERRDYIFKNQLFGISGEHITSIIAQSNLYGQIGLYDNIKYIKNLDTIIKSNSINIFKIIQEEFGQNMRFNVVIGNPPYNNDMYLEFVQAGHILAKDYTVMITPAKWQGKGGGATKNFVRQLCHI